MAWFLTDNSEVLHQNAFTYKIFKNIKIFDITQRLLALLFGVSQKVLLGDWYNPKRPIFL